MANYYKNNKPKFREHNFKRKYGITTEEYYLLLEKQEKSCAICKTTEDVRYKKQCLLSIDHDHETKKIRGILCSRCNRALGLFKDDKEVLKRAYEYLVQSRE